MASPPPTEKEKVVIQVLMTRGQRLLTTEKNLLKVHSVVFFFFLQRILNQEKNLH